LQNFILTLKSSFRGAGTKLRFKFGDNLINGFRDIAFLVFYKMAPAAILNFKIQISKTLSYWRYRIGDSC